MVKKLLLFTALMVSAPLIVFFATRSLTDNDIVSGGAAAFVANVVMMLYVYIAFNEDVSPSYSSKEVEKKKEQ